MYEKLITLHDECIQKAAKTKDNLVKQFLVRAAEGFKIKAMALKLKEV
jgi:hypothetical protein